MPSYHRQLCSHSEKYQGLLPLSLGEKLLSGLSCSYASQIGRNQIINNNVAARESRNVVLHFLNRERLEYILSEPTKSICLKNFRVFCLHVVLY
jgi:hypothetical protein